MVDQGLGPLAYHCLEFVFQLVLFLSMLVLPVRSSIPNLYRVLMCHLLEFYFSLLLSALLYFLTNLYFLPLLFILLAVHDC